MSPGADRRARAAPGGWRPGRWPLALQLALAFALVTALALAGGGALLLNQAQARQLADRSRTLLAQANAAANLVAELEAAGDPAELALGLYRFHQQTGARAVVIGPDGAARADSVSPSPLAGQPMTQPEVAAALTGKQTTGTRRLASGQWVMYGAVPIWQGRQPAGAVLLSADIGTVAAALADLRRQLWLVAAAAGALAVVLGVALARWLSAPLERLSRAAAELARGRLETRVRPRGSREIRHLGDSFNRMAAELGRLDRQRRAFVADASHELRTPVASIRALADSLLTDATGDVALYKEYLGDITRECDRAARLVDRLLELARLDLRQEARTGAAADRAGTAADRSGTAADRSGATADYPGAAADHPGAAGDGAAPLDLAQAAAEVVQALMPLARERGVALELLAPAPVTVPADPRLVEAVLGNLVENALKYTPAGGQASVEVGARPGAALVAVSDTGPGIAPEHLPHIFERFYRVDRARSRATGGAGLGLSIAAEAAGLLGGEIEVESEVGRGSRFTLVIPDPAAGRAPGGGSAASGGRAANGGRIPAGGPGAAD